MLKILLTLKKSVLNWGSWFWIGVGGEVFLPLVYLFSHIYAFRVFFVFLNKKVQTKLSGNEEVQVEKISVNASAKVLVQICSVRIRY